jgi:hypothetical protein
MRGEKSIHLKFSTALDRYTALKASRVHVWLLELRESHDYTVLREYIPFDIATALGGEF